MRVECERCHALVAADLTLDGDGVLVGCVACGAQVRVAARAPATRPASSSSSSSSPTTGCPKCGAPATDGDACPRCGLARAHAQTWADAGPPPTAALADAWTALAATWTDPAAHDRVAGLALEHQALPWLARRYREVTIARPDDAVARARLDRIANMSMAAVRAAAAVPGRHKASALPYVLLVCALVVAAVLIAVQLSATSARRARARAPAGPTLPLGGTLPPIEPGGPRR